MNKLLAVLAVSLLTAISAQAAHFADVNANGGGFISVDEAMGARPDATEDAFAAAHQGADGNRNAGKYAAMGE